MFYSEVLFIFIIPWGYICFDEGLVLEKRTNSVLSYPKWSDNLLFADCGEFFIQKTRIISINMEAWEKKICDSSFFLRFVFIELIFFNVLMVSWWFQTKQCSKFWSKLLLKLCRVRRKRNKKAWFRDNFFLKLKFQNFLKFSNRF